MKQKEALEDREGWIWIKNAADSRAKKGMPGPWAECGKKKTDHVLKIRIAGKPGLLYNKIRQIPAHRRKA